MKQQSLSLNEELIKAPDNANENWPLGVERRLDGMPQPQSCAHTGILSGINPEPSLASYAAEKCVYTSQSDTPHLSAVRTVAPALELEPPITLVRNYLNLAQQAALLTESARYPFTRPSISVYGRNHLIPRQQVWFGDNGCDYLYSGLFIRALPWPKYALKLRQKLARDFDLSSNGVLVNQYANGQDCMGAHSDDEPELAPGSDIASVSIGAAREFVIKHKFSPLKRVITLNSGDLLLMHAPMQAHWQHSLPKRASVTSSRLNYTFRQLIVNYHQG